MPKATRFALRFVVLFAVVVALAALLNTGSPTQSPYVSALSGLATPSAFAAPCPNVACDVDAFCTLVNHKTKCQFQIIHGVQVCNTISC